MILNSSDTSAETCKPQTGDCHYLPPHGGLPVVCDALQFCCCPTVPIVMNDGGSPAGTPLSVVAQFSESQSFRWDRMP
jgi:hypothetical protein